jgi:hypothetical protein
LAKRDYNPKDTTGKILIQPTKGEPMLLVCYLSNTIDLSDSLPLIQVSTEIGPPNSHIAKTNWYDRVAINTKSVTANYKVLLIPFNNGDALPEIIYQNNKATISWKDGQKDLLLFTNNNNRTSITVMRNDIEIIKSK